MLMHEHKEIFILKNLFHQTFICNLKIEKLENEYDLQKASLLER